MGRGDTLRIVAPVFKFPSTKCFAGNVQGAMRIYKGMLAYAVVGVEWGSSLVLRIKNPKQKANNSPSSEVIGESLSCQGARAKKLSWSSCPGSRYTGVLSLWYSVERMTLSLCHGPKYDEYLVELDAYFKTASLPVWQTISSLSW